MDNQKHQHHLEEERKRRAAVEQDLNLRLRQQEAIAGLGEFALASRDLDTLFGQAARLVAETLDMEFCKVLELLPDGKSLLLRAGVGWKEGLVGRATVSADRDSLAGYTLMNNEPIIVQDLRAEQRFRDPVLLVDHHVISGMSVVIPGKDRPFGVLGTHSTRQRTFYPADTRFIKAIASILASAIERFRSEDALGRSRDELAIILNGVTEGVTVQDCDGKLVFANQAAARIFGYDSAEEFLTAPLSSLMRQFDMLDEAGNPLPAEQLPGRLVLKGAPRATAIVRFRAQDAAPRIGDADRIENVGEERWSIVDATPIRDEAGNVIQAVNIFRDITAMVQAEQDQKLLADAGSLLASSLDYKTTLANVAQLAVTNLADWCSVYLFADGRQASRLVAAHRDPAKVSLAREYQRRYPLNMEAEGGIAGVLRSGRALYLPVITDEMLAAAAADAEHLAIIRALGMRSAIFVPLNVRGRTLGAIAFIWAESGRRYTRRDADLANELAHRAALAIDNAGLYQEAQLSNAGLEKRVTERTRELEQSNEQLLREVEERRKTEAALQKSELMLNSLFEAAPDAIVLVDLAGRIMRVNRQAETAFGYQRDELIGLSIDRLIPQRFRLRHTRSRLNYLQNMMNRAMGMGSELFALRQDNTEFPVEITLNPVQTEQGEMVICAIRNRSEHKRLQEELAEIHRRLFESVEAERLAISQELHDGPIQDLYGLAIYLETMKDVLSNTEDIEELQAAKQNLQGVIQSLRNICGELRPPTITHLGLEKSIRSHLLRMREAHPDINFETHLASDGSMLSERTRLALYRVYQNAISNTIRHAQAHNVKITFAIEEGEIRFRIQDDGRGFDVPRKWVSLAREGHFGLVGMTERVEAIGGRLEVESAPGKGTTIAVNVPLEQPSISELRYLS